MASDRLDSRKGFTRLLPWWYVDMKADQKRLMGSVTILGGLIPCLVIAWISSSHAANFQHQIDALVASGKGTKPQLLALTEQMQSSLSHSHTAMIVGAVWAFATGLFSTRASTTLTRNWLLQLVKMTDEIADGDLSREIVRDNGSHIGDMQEAIGKMTASFRATINRIELAAAELRDAAAEMAHTSDEAGHAIGEVAQSISAISEGASHQVDLVTRHFRRRRRDRAFSPRRRRPRRSRPDAERRHRSVDRRRRDSRHRNSGSDAVVRETSLATQEMVRSLGEKSTTST